MRLYKGYKAFILNTLRDMMSQLTPHLCYNVLQVSKSHPRTLYFCGIYHPVKECD